eukprot:c2708_g1_i1.p1 GENE.c2708_g1_i1~~c2708_g1_i1.p1  ORF type:complete len:399 (+),score=77.53 c2708_g1_i1:520-1716(+)
MLRRRLHAGPSESDHKDLVHCISNMSEDSGPLASRPPSPSSAPSPTPSTRYLTDHSALSHMLAERFVCIMPSQPLDDSIMQALLHGIPLRTRFNGCVPSSISNRYADTPCLLQMTCTVSQGKAPGSKAQRADVVHTTLIDQRRKSHDQSTSEGEKYTNMMRYILFPLDKRWFAQHLKLLQTYASPTGSARFVGNVQYVPWYHGAVQIGGLAFGVLDDPIFPPEPPKSCLHATVMQRVVAEAGTSTNCIEALGFSVDSLTVMPVRDASGESPRDARPLTLDQSYCVHLTTKDVHVAIRRFLTPANGAMDVKVVERVIRELQALQEWFSKQPVVFRQIAVTVVYTSRGQAMARVLPIGQFEEAELVEGEDGEFRPVLSEPTSLAGLDNLIAVFRGMLVES